MSYLFTNYKTRLVSGACVYLFVTLQMIHERKRKRLVGLDGEDNVHSSIKRQRKSDASSDSDFVDHRDSSTSVW